MLESFPTILSSLNTEIPISSTKYSSFLEVILPTELSISISLLLEDFNEEVALLIIPSAAYGCFNGSSKEE